MDPADTNVFSLQSEDGVKLLDDIDDLRSHGISRFVSLPQIIVVGDQSSGKSSVLEAISGVAFPTNDGLCTRFPTEVILRRSKDEKASVRIRPSAGCDPERKLQLERFHQTHIALTQVSSLVAEAQTAMGVEEQTSFSKDVLELEISGPTLPHLTLVDLPGIFHSPTAKQGKGDPASVTKLVKSYMEEERSIILAVISGKYDHAVQQIVGMLKSVDADGSRTLGVLTKPDAIEPGSADEQAFISLARNSDVPLKLGWHVLRNPSFKERRDPGFDRDRIEEQFFANSTPWNTLSSGHVGVVALRLRLSRLLFDHITSELPKLVKSIEGELARCKSILDDLGPQRSSCQDQRLYLTIIAERFQRLAEDGIEGLHRDKYYTLATGQRIRAKVQKAHSDFATRMAQEGQRWLILPETADRRGLWETPGLILPPEGQARAIERNLFIERVRKLLENNRGRELQGNYNPLLVRELFQIQSVSWERLAYDHARDVVGMVTTFVENLMEHVAGEERAEVLLKRLIDPAIEQMQEHLEAKVAELLTPYTKGYPTTLNPDFAAAFAKVSEADKAKAETLVDAERKAELLACSRLVDCMECYYKIALGVFMDNVATLAVENCVLNNIDSLISPTTVAKMSDEDLKLLASESPDAARTRQETSAKQEALQKGLKTCETHARRKASLSRPTKSPSSAGADLPAVPDLVFGSSPSRSVTPAGLSPRTPAARFSSSSRNHPRPGTTAAHSSGPLLSTAPGSGLFSSTISNPFYSKDHAKAGESQGSTLFTPQPSKTEDKTPTSAAVQLRASGILRVKRDLPLHSKSEAATDDLESRVMEICNGFSHMPHAHQEMDGSSTILFPCLSEALAKGDGQMSFEEVRLEDRRKLKRDGNVIGKLMRECNPDLWVEPSKPEPWVKQQWCSRFVAIQIGDRKAEECLTQ